MSNAPSPNRFSGAEDHFFDHIDISEKMRVPKRIKVAGDSSDSPGSPGKHNPWQPEKFDMNVPDRILVVGQDQYYGTSAPPREVMLENTVMPPDPGLIRVQTPPRVITMSEHFFPTVDDEEDIMEMESPETPPKISKNVKNHHIQNKSINNSTVEWTPVAAINGAGQGLQRGLAPTEELAHLRRQVGKLNRRLMAIELDNLQRQQREKYLLALGMGYFLIKFVIWLNK